MSMLAWAQGENWSNIISVWRGCPSLTLEPSSCPPLEEVGRLPPQGLVVVEVAGRTGRGHRPLRPVFQHEMLRYKEVCYYMLFALAAYGWPMYLMRKPTCGLCQLARSCS